MDFSTPGCPVHHQLLELAQTHAHRVRDAIQPSHPLSSPSPLAFNLWNKGISSVQLFCRVPLFAIPWVAAHQASLSITNSQSSFKLTSIKLVMSSSHLILCRPLLLLLPPIPPSIRLLSNESTLRMRWPKDWSFSFSIIPSKEHPGLISFRMDWLDLLAIQGTLKSLLQHYRSKASILQSSAFFTVQFSHPYTTAGKTIALTRRTFVVWSKGIAKQKIQMTSNLNFWKREERR